MTREEAIYLIKSMKYKAMPQEADAIDMAIEALERKRGEWVLTDGYRCSQCNYKLQTTGIPMYCPNCGADMREREEE